MEENIKMGKFKSVFRLAISAVVVLSLIVVPMLSTTASAADSASLSISPKKNYRIEAGKTIEDTLTITNLDKKEPLNLSLKVIDFTYIEDGGAPKLMLDQTVERTTWSLKPFLKAPESVTIDPKSTKTVDISISIPKEQGAGSYYSALVYSSGGSDGGNVGLSASGVTLVFVTVPGQVSEKLTLENLGSYQMPSNGAKGRYTKFNFSMPENIGFTLKNEGNVFESPVGSITLKPLFGKPIRIDNINPNSTLALIGQTRTFTPCIKTKKEDVNFNGARSEANSCTSPGLWPGFYSVELNAFYGQNGNQTRDIVGHSWFFYLPWWFILAVLVVSLYVGFQIWKLVRYIKRRQNGSDTTKPSKKRK